MASQPLTPSEIQAKVRQFVAEDPEKGWDKAWQAKTTPWDFGETQPALRELIESDAVKLPTSGTALVPGCGRGYDAIYLASKLDHFVLGVDISDTAINAANELLGSNPALSERVKFAIDDFFNDDLSVGGQKTVDLVYDYTFFVAIPPQRRPEWGKRMAALVKPGGYLITLVFPIDPPQDYGPPWFVRPEHYEEVLGMGWEKVHDRVPENSAKTHVNRERMIVWRKL
ncbi:S-adenosyl-L-methionine-dependent methyltransferase [Cristinia sonorae]|uniref:S-adenosyl-L-methionine-dependent methyltransferase n=1 Tax=Cristinia sonorae TaxID=1940300 RepID=A0A8K0XTS0_9AGAR|nr:S-adenosyl-L-methionine-dependent methyltransferase [Cristinia sonorae]